MPSAKANVSNKSVEISGEASREILSTKKQVSEEIRKGLLGRKEKIKVSMKYSVLKKIQDMKTFLEEIETEDDKTTAKDADYLQYSIKQWHTKTSWVEGGEATITLNVIYKCSNEEEKKLDKEIKSAIKTLELTEKSDYEKVKAIHDYIINRVSYDTTLIGNSAYDALINKSAVCEGYAMAAYRMFTEAGLEARIISGFGNGVPHAWNIVKVEGKWYNIDLTWDDPVTSNGTSVITYDYFLKNAKDFSDHRSNTEYRTDKFLKEYIISETSCTME
jgi:transglutaminase/protease-like cytokinesis protein 3